MKLENQLSLYSVVIHLSLCLYSILPHQLMLLSFLGLFSKSLHVLLTAHKVWILQITFAIHRELVPGIYKYLQLSMFTSHVNTVVFAFIYIHLPIDLRSSLDFSQYRIQHKQLFYCIFTLFFFTHKCLHPWMWNPRILEVDSSFICIYV